MAPRRLLAIVGAVMVVVAAATALYLRGQHNDCDTIHGMASYNAAFNADVDRSPPEDAEPYRKWAAELRRQADTVRDSGLKARAESLADDADRYAELAPRMQSYFTEADAAGEPGPRPPWVSEAEGVGKKFHDDLAALAAGCR